MDGKNYNGAPAITKQPVLRQMLVEYFAKEGMQLRDSVFVPLGPKVREALMLLVSERVIDASRVLDGIPHPSGANQERIDYILGRKSRSSLSIKTDPEKLDAARESLQVKIAALRRTPLNSNKHSVKAMGPSVDSASSVFGQLPQKMQQGKGSCTERANSSASLQLGHHRQARVPKQRARSDYVDVPKAADGSIFAPCLRRSKGYRIGPKGSEVWVAEYFEALDELSRARPPRWRRPSPTSGVPGIVTGICKVRVEIDTLLQLEFPHL